MKRLLPIALLWLLSGCYASLNVKMDSLDSQALKQSPEYLQGEADILRKTILHRLEPTYLPQLQSSVRNASEEQLDKAISDAGLGKAAKSPILNAIHQHLDKATGSTRDHYEKALAALDTFDMGPGREQFNQAMMHKLKGDRFLDDFLESLSTDLSMLGGGVNVQLAVTEVRSRAEAVREELDRYYGGDVTTDPLASLVTRVPNEYWRKYRAKTVIESAEGQRKRSRSRKARLNRTVVRTWLGNADIAIKMHRPGMFVVKGVRLDANEAIKASFKVLNQGIKYLAYAQGVPVPAGQQGEDAQPHQVVPEIAQNEQLRYQLEAEEQRSREATNAFLAVVFSQQQAIENTDGTAASAAGKVTAWEIIEEAYQAYKQQLTTQNTTP